METLDVTHHPIATAERPFGLRSIFRLRGRRFQAGGAQRRRSAPRPVIRTGARRPADRSETWRLVVIDAATDVISGAALASATARGPG